MSDHSSTTGKLAGACLVFVSYIYGISSYLWETSFVRVLIIFCLLNAVAGICCKFIKKPFMRGLICSGAWWFGNITCIVVITVWSLREGVQPAWQYDFTVSGIIFVYMALLLVASALGMFISLIMYNLLWFSESRKVSRDYCPNCGYCLKNFSSARCSECGENVVDIINHND